MTLRERLTRRIDDGYRTKIGNGKGEWPPYKLDVTMDRAAYRQYVFDCIDEVCEDEVCEDEGFPLCDLRKPWWVIKGHGADARVHSTHHLRRHARGMARNLRTAGSPALVRHVRLLQTAGSG